MKKRACLALVAVAIVFVAFEAGLRIAGFHAPAKILDYRLRISGELHGEPDLHRFWKLPDRLPHFDEDAFKIVCLADSVTVMDQGHGYPEMLPRAMRARGSTENVRVFNAGAPEYTVYQGRVYLERELIQSRPDVVTVQFGINDHWRAPGGISDPYVNMPSVNALRVHRALAKLRTYQALRTLVLPAAKRSGGGHKPYRVIPEDYVENLEKIIEICAAGKARPIVILSPYLDIGQDWAPLHRRYIRLTLKTAEKHGAAVVDLIDRFRFDPSLFMEPKTDHVHFNEAGAQIIADKIAETILKDLP